MTKITDSKYPLAINFIPLCKDDAYMLIPFSLAQVTGKYVHIHVYYVFINMPGEAEKWRVSDSKHALAFYT